MQSLTTPFKLHWSIDRITVVGKLKKYRWVRDDLQVIDLDFEQVWQIFESQGFAEQRGQGWVLLDKYGEKLAPLVKKNDLSRSFFRPNFQLGDLNCGDCDIIIKLALAKEVI